MTKKTLQDRMNDMKPYFRGIEMYNEALIVKVQFPNKWKPYDSKDGRIKATPSETTANEIFYYASSENATYDDIFDLIEETIKANQDILLKVKLLRDKVEELRGLFSELSYEELSTLKFVTDSNKGKRKHVKKGKILQSENKEETSNEESVEVINDGKEIEEAVNE